MRKKKSTKKSKNGVTIKSNETKMVIGLLLAVASIALIMAPFFEATVFTQITNQLGRSAVIWGIAGLYLSLKFILNSDGIFSFKIFLGLLLLALTTQVFLTFWIPEEELINTIITPDFAMAGGELGYQAHVWLDQTVGKLLEFIILLVAYIFCFSLVSGVKIEQIRDLFANIFSSIASIFPKRKPTENEDELYGNSSMFSNQKNANLFGDGKEPSEFDNELGTAKRAPLFQHPQQNVQESQHRSTDPIMKEPEFISSYPQTAGSTTTDTDSEGIILAQPKFPNWAFPPISLLKDPVIQPQNREILRQNVKIIERTLMSFGVEAKVKNITTGPTVVQYALSITVGTKVAKIRNLSNDLALALSAPASSIRIETPIPGTSLIGIEVPNPTPNFVFEKEMVAQLEESRDMYELPLVLGKSVAGKHIIKDLTSLPHVLVAGATGTGKSVGINAIIVGLLMTKTPDEVKLILVDPKMVEMSPYNGIPHLLTPVITDMELVVNAFQWAVEEMLRRYRMLKQLGVRKISEYNKKMGFTAMPYIVIVIDEMADLMLSSGVDVESKIVRLTQMSRAVGIHLILATQRPSVDVITGLIKANVPGRIAFSVATAIDSRVVIDQSGAENLIGKGDLLFKSPELPKPLRIQGAYTDIKDIEKVVDFIKEQTSEKVDYSEEILKPASQAKTAGGQSGTNEKDELFADALEAVINAQKASASYLQRKFRIGYNRAARLIDELQDAGAIGPQQGSNARDVLVESPEQILGKGSEEDQDIKDIR